MLLINRTIIFACAFVVARGGHTEALSLVQRHASIVKTPVTSPVSDHSDSVDLDVGDCDWSIEYDRWIPEFQSSTIANREFDTAYEHRDVRGGVHCLRACCKDPSCAGLAMRASLEGQCYKYDTLPTKGLTLEPLSAFLPKATSVEPAWSVLFKSPRGSSTNSVRHEVDLDEELAHSLAQAAAPTGGCEWEVYYDKWIPTFEKEVFRGPVGLGGHRLNHCLDACCADPTCEGLAMDAWEDRQCYKYVEVPRGLDNTQGRRLGDGAWLQQQNQAWSILVRVRSGMVGIGGSVIAGSSIEAGKKGSAEEESTSSKRHEVDLDEELSHSIARPAAPTFGCEWEVHYDKWIPTFEKEMFRRPVALGGPRLDHCLDACCADPTCQGLAMDAWEDRQCYKYASVPLGLDANQGRRLRDGAWLQQQKQAWSIFVRVRPGIVGTSGGHLEGSDWRAATVATFFTQRALALHFVAAVLLLIAVLARRWKTADAGASLNFFGSLKAVPCVSLIEEAADALVAEAVEPPAQEAAEETPAGEAAEVATEEITEALAEENIEASVEESAEAPIEESTEEVAEAPAEEATDKALLEASAEGEAAPADDSFVAPPSGSMQGRQLRQLLRDRASVEKCESPVPAGL